MFDLNTEFVSFLSCLLFSFCSQVFKIKVFFLFFRPYRPMFGTPGKVPGSASLLRASETGRLNSARTQSRSTTPGILHALSLEKSFLFLRPKFYLVSRHVVSKIKLNKCEAFSVTYNWVYFILMYLLCHWLVIL